MTEHRSSNTVIPDEVIVSGRRYRLAGVVIPDRLGAHLMYDCHLFRRCKGHTVREVVEDWQQEHDKPSDRYGRPCLCPMIVLEGKTELRRVGPMVHANYTSTGPELRAAHDKALVEWIAACEADPDIPRLLAAGANDD